MQCFDGLGITSRYSQSDPRIPALNAASARRNCSGTGLFCDSNTNNLKGFVPSSKLS